ncbi:MAG: hypothetical protein EA447_02405 [Nitrosopumilus sp.]|nr:MAG: hypothetical protein EA447_02405 [Nitrosopumilus sp.]
MSVDVNSQSFNEDMIAEIKKIQDELNELKNLEVKISKKSTKKPAKKTAVEKKTVQRKPAKKTAVEKKTVQRKVVRKTSKSKKKSR